MKIFISTLIAIVLFSFGSAHADHTIDQVKYDSILNHFAEVATVWTKEHHKVRVLATGDWAKEYNPTSAGGSAYTKYEGKEFVWGVNLVGWVARHPSLDEDSLYFTLCHELGHLVFGRGDEEGADYFPARTCLRWFWQDDPNINERIMASYEKAHLFRLWVWDIRKVEVDAEEVYQCRKSVVLLGIEEKDISYCEDSTKQ